MIPKLVLAFTVLLGITTATAASERYTVDKAQTDVSFEIRHITGPVRGSFGDCSGTIELDPALPERSSVEFRIRAASIDTGNEKRDTHLRTADFFDVASHPDIVFTSTRIVAKGPAQFDVYGRLTMRGVTRDVVLPVTRLGATDPHDAGRVAFRTAVTLNRKDYNILWNRALDTGGWVLADEVNVSISLKAVRQASEGTR